MKICKELGLFFYVYRLPSKVKEKALQLIIKKLNKQKEIDGIIIQLPISKHLDPHKIVHYISPKKDVDGLHPYNLGQLVEGKSRFIPCTPLGIMCLFDYYKINVQGLNCLIIGYSKIVGQPMSIILTQKGATTTTAHVLTKNLNFHIRNAELLICAVGKPNFISGNDIKKNSIVIDVGINYLKNGTLVGDINYNQTASKVKYITPVPGGVGPMTVIMLIKNTLKSYEINQFTYL